MILGLHLNDLTWPGGSRELGPKLAEVAQTAEAAGYARLTVMDHFWQIEGHGRGAREDAMLESYTTLGFLAAQTARVELFTLVTGVTYRPPGMLAKIVSTLDVLSGGRAWLGLGAAWYEEEAVGLGLPYAPTAERFERVEEVVQVCRQMWSGNTGPYHGKYYELASTLNSPQPLSQPRIMIGGNGEKKTMRLVAKYADACNVFYGLPGYEQKLEVLREHCERAGRDYESIEKTASMPMSVTGDGGVNGLLERLRVLHDLGYTAVHGALEDVSSLTPLEVMGSEVIPEIASW